VFPSFKRPADPVLLREQYRSLARLLPAMYAVVLTISLVLAIMYYNVLPAWLGVGAPGVLGLFMVYRAAHWAKARDQVDALTPAQHEREIRAVTAFGIILSFGYTLIAMLVLGHGSPEQQILALVLIWAVTAISAFCGSVLTVTPMA
jgi:predicted signal transduction protein with EAL and GGDEF domain